MLRAAAVGRDRPVKARRCILLFLTGGPPQLDTWDLKPNAPSEIRGETRPIPTRVVGLQVSELFPLLAQQAHRLCVVRSVTHSDRTHTSAGYQMLTGIPHPNANAASAQLVRPGSHDHPHVGSLLARVRSSTDGVPPFVSLPEMIKDAGVNPYPGLDGGLLGGQVAPLCVEANPERTEFQLPQIVLPSDISAERLADRTMLLSRVDQTMRAAEPRLATMTDHYRQAFQMLHSRRVREAFDLGREDRRIREHYGQHLFGQGCLLARRLAEAWR